MKKYNNKLVKTMISVSLGLALSACGSDSKETPITIPDTVINAAPTITSNAETTVASGVAYSYLLVGADVDGDTLTMSATNLPAWLTFDSATGILSGTAAETDAGEYAITLTVSDGTDDITQSFTINVTAADTSPDNNPAVITSSGITTATVGEAYAYTLTATDADNDTLTMSATIPNELSWLTFDATSGILSGTPASGDIATTAITLTVNDGTEDTTQTFNIEVDETVIVSNVIDFEEASDTYVFNNFDGGMSEVVANPQVTGIDVSAQVVKMEKFAGQQWGGSTLTLPTAMVLDAADNTFKLKVYADRAVPVLFKLEGINKELSVNHTGSGWEELTFDFGTDAAGSLSAVTMIFDLGVMGDAENDASNWTFYYDDLSLPTSKEVDESGFVAVGTPYDFEAAGFGGDFTWAVFENDGNAPLEFVANPGSSALNDSAIVAMFTAKQAGQAWAGTETTAANTTPFTMDASNSIVKIMVYKSVISDVGLKFSVGAAAQGELKVANTKINEWEELTFDFSSRVGSAETINIDSVIVFPDFNTDGRASDTVSYFDNITFGHYE
ncbi:putative Ig domain-containing protein [Colwellia echini]|nr:putative Ig domain-containing protein [Colwellia echini]